MNGESSFLNKIVGDKHRRQAVMILAPMAIGVLFFGGKLIVSETQESDIPSAAVKRGQVLIKITEIGELRAQKQVTISAVNDKQITWLVPEGQWVEKGDTLLKMQSEKYEISTSEARSALRVARAQLRKALSELEAQRTKEEAALKNYEALPELAEKGFVMESEVEQARLAYLELKSKTSSYEAAVDAARAAVDRETRALDQQERKLREGATLAPRAGLVVYALVGSQENLKKIELGMTPFEGMDLMYLPDISSMLVDAEISEVDLSKIQAGMKAEIRLDAYPDAVFQGEVSNIADLARRKVSRITGKLMGAKVFDVTIKIFDEDLRLKPGLTATVDIIVNQYDDTLYIPLEGIFLDEQEDTYVYVKKDGKIETREVTIGETNDRVAVVLEGVEEGEEILLGRPITT